MITPSFGLTATERVLPKLALDFTAASLDSRITFTRTTGASNPATYVDSSGFITTATNNQPRFDYDPVTLACKGLLIEESRINVAQYSEDFTAVTWTKGNVTIVSNSITAPSNQLTADTMVETATTGQHYAQEVLAVSPGVAYTLSFFAKAKERTKISILMAQATSPYTLHAEVVFDLAAGTVYSSTVGSGSITPMSNGWFRCSAVGTTSSTTEICRISLADSTGNTTYTGNGSSGAFIWGAQFEAGAFATSYIPTEATALTRNADVATMTGTNFSDWWQASKGGISVRARPGTVIGTRPLMQFDDGTANEIIALRGNTTNPELYIVDGGAPQAQIDAGTIAANTAYNLGAAWGTDNCASALNGGAAVTDTSATIPTVTQARFGSDGTNYLNGQIQTVRYWPQRITNAEVQAFSK